MPSAVGCSVMSETHRRFGSCATKRRRTGPRAAPAAAWHRTVCGDGRPRPGQQLSSAGRSACARKRCPTPDVARRATRGLRRWLARRRGPQRSFASRLHRPPLVPRPVARAIRSSRAGHTQYPAGHRDGDREALVVGKVRTAGRSFWVRQHVPSEVGTGPLEDLDLHRLHPGLAAQLEQFSALTGVQRGSIRTASAAGTMHHCCRRPGRTQRRRQDSLTPRSAAILPSGCSRSRTSSTARCRNSGG